ncbi:Two-component sensor histidine kinase, contains HisKA and HATPase domains [Arboricoccus pini]|uniref:histidine kinase n=1 Tax=Arboricoccus pini TaxID=1963835 RepID=A0A212RYQ1_9PROT|nr:PAS domain-containing protein [Arboricoccus pini]SNB77798.1 Two-component sensor histidine kinase, contains HisKA and HATPase domains [Arboricoccus pini]
METAAGIYARIMFSDAVSLVDPQLSDLQKAMLDATPDCIKVVSVDGKLLTMNRAGCVALNVPETSGFGMPWLSLLPEDVRPAGMEALRLAAAGQNARFGGKSISPIGTVYWDNLLTPLIGAGNQVLSILCVSRDVTEKTLLERQLEEAVQREKLLAGEMRHRIKNIFSVVSGLISIAEKQAASADTTDTATDILRGKLDALSRASDAIFARQTGGWRDADPVDVALVVPSVLQPYGDRCTVIGNSVLTRRDSMTTFALFLHELATNSVKYGALSRDEGNVLIRWVASDSTIDLTWIETGGPPVWATPKHRGFGTEMVDRMVRSAQGTINRTWCPEGLMVNLHVPNIYTSSPS